MTTATDAAIIDGHDVDPRYGAVMARDRTWDGAFVFGVTSTCIYCRPSCPARRPRADRVLFFPDVERARAAGFRACKRCSPDSVQAPDSTTAAVVQALELLAKTTSSIPLAELAAGVKMSRAHLQRAFTGIVGCSPREWQLARRSERLRDLLTSPSSGPTVRRPTRSPERLGSSGAEVRSARSAETRKPSPSTPTVSSAAFEAGFNSLPAAYSAASVFIAISPGRWRLGAPGENIFFTVVECALGSVLVAMTKNGICRVILGDDGLSMESQFRSEVHAATLVKDDAAVVEIANAVVGTASGHQLASALPLDLRGTAFQCRVWKELTRIPRGETITYGELARRIGAPRAVRAVGTACGANPAALVVPCHRVKRGDGTTGGYRWGVERKERLLAMELE